MAKKAPSLLHTDRRLPAVQHSKQGLYLPEADLWLDPLGPKPAAFISHAHSDHARACHAHAYATAATHQLMALRGRACGGEPLAYGQVVQRNGCQLWLESAGHVLGSAQLVCQTPTGRVVFTGDCKLRPSRTAGPQAKPIPCDVLIIEATFGLPIYRFPPQEELERLLISTAQQALAERQTPIFLAYTLGKGQEVAKVLADAGLPVRCWGSMAPILRVYAQHGVDVSAIQQTTADAPLEGVCLVIPPEARLHPGIAKRKQTRVAYCSGWALLDASYDRMDADVLIPISDHFDWPQILTYVEEARPQRVLVTHGYCEPLARELRRRGVDAEPIGLAYGQEEGES